MKTTISRTLLMCGLSLAMGLAQASPVNEALGKPATASGSYTGGGYSIASGNDGNLGTIWNGGAHDASWTVDLLSVMPISQIVVSGMDGPGYHIRFQLSSSADGTNWTLIDPSTVGSGPAWSFAFNTADTLMRYITYTTIGESGSDWGLLAELEAYRGTTPASNVPVPATLGLLGAGLLALNRARRGRDQGNATDC